MILPVLAALLLQPVLAEDGDVRLVAAGTGSEETRWFLDGSEVAYTGDREAVTVPVAAGAHEMWAVSSSRSPWTAMARLEPPPGDGAVFVPAWTASHPGEGSERGASWPPWALPGALAAAAVLLFVPRRRSKSP